MPSTILLKRSSTASSVPAAGSLQAGELAVNLADQKLYSKTAGGTVVQVGFGNLTSTMVTTALGFAPYNSTNPNGYVTASGSISGSSGSCTGNAANATRWATGRTIALTCDVTGTSAAFDGSAALSFAATLANSGVAAGTYTKVTVDAKGRVTTGASLTAADVPEPSAIPLPTRLERALPVQSRLQARSPQPSDITAYSDARLKTGVETMSNALDLVNRLRGVSFTRIDSGTRGIRVIAPELGAVVPEAVHSNDDGLLSVAYGNLVGVLIEAVKELANKVERLESSS